MIPDSSKQQKALSIQWKGLDDNPDLTGIIDSLVISPGKMLDPGPDASCSHPEQDGEGHSISIEEAPDASLITSLGEHLS